MRTYVILSQRKATKLKSVLAFPRVIVLIKPIITASVAFQSTRTYYNNEDVQLKTDYYVKGH